MTFSHEKFKEWFLTNRREFPWREDPTPYRVWVSEVMLQQTQASVVVPYFERWMEAFPTIEALAAADLDEVIKLWEGLGYYSRARNLHRAAQGLASAYLGSLPEDPEELAQIHGIGPYTQGAIRSFAFHQKAIAVDGNVARVVARYFALQESICSSKGKKKVEALTESLLPDEEPWLVMEGLIELGALICGKKPKCLSCPLKGECQAFQQGEQEKLPIKNKREQAIPLYRFVGVIRSGSNYLLKKGKKGKVMADLYEFPFVEIDPEKTENGLELLEEELGIALRYVSALPEQRHTFTKYRVRLFPHLLETDTCDPEFEWKEELELHALPFSSGHRRIMQAFLEEGG